MHYYHHNLVQITDHVLMLPQRGASSGGTGRPPNSYAVLFEGGSVLIDSGFSWNLAGLETLAATGHKPVMVLLTHRHIPMGADAMDELRQAFGMRFLLHPADASHQQAEGGGPYDDPATDEEVARRGFTALHVPGHTEGSVVYSWQGDGRVLFTGDCAVGPGPRQTDITPRLQRPLMKDPETSASFEKVWSDRTKDLAPRAILPYHGDWYGNVGDAAGLLLGVVENPPMNPAG